MKIDGPRIDIFNTEHIEFNALIRNICRRFPTHVYSHNT
jgi:hypothetical protein